VRLPPSRLPALIAAATATATATAAPAALAHSPFDLDRGVPWPALFTALLLALAWVAYLLGQRRLRRRSPRRAALFHFTLALLALTLFGPLDHWAERSVAAHMTQHMLLMVAIAPLGVLARPLPVWRAALGAGSDRLWRPLLAFVRAPMPATLLHAAAIWGWHAPGPYMLAVRDPFWHAIEHACFLLTAWWWWWSVLRSRASNSGAALLALVLTMAHTGLLGALLTFSGRLIYHESGALADQQLAGLIMWVPGSFAYLLGLAWCVRRWLPAAKSFM
jgi:cytochrome c oxidase assembly factor CtaG